MKPKPLNLEDQKIEEIVKKRLKSRKDYKYLYDIFDVFLKKAKTNLERGFVMFPNAEEKVAIDILAIFELAINETIQEIKQRLKSTCEFYLRYKDKPAKILEDNIVTQEEMDKIRVKSISKDIGFIKFYNEWLFKLAFKDVLGDSK